MDLLQRKKLAIMSRTNNGSGITKRVSGVPPLTLQDCLGNANLIDYKIYGDSLQEGTPSPENPVEIKAVGDKTTNLLDVNAMENDFMVINDDESVTFEIIYNDDGTEKSRFSKYVPVYLKANTPYCIEGIIEEGNLLNVTDQQIGVILKDKEGNQVQATGLADYCLGSRTIIFSKDVYSAGFYLSAGIKGYIRMSDLRIVEATNRLFNIVNEPVNEYAEFEVNPYTGDEEVIAWYAYTVTPLDGNTESQFLVQYLDANNNILGSAKLKKATNLSSLWLPTARKMSKIRIYAGSTADTSVGKSINFSFSIIAGSHEYEPYGKYKIPITSKTEDGDSVTSNIYLDYPLSMYPPSRGSNYVYDFIDYNKNKLYRRGKEIILTGEENGWAEPETYTGRGYHSYAISLSNYVGMGYVLYARCTHYGKNVLSDIGWKTGMYAVNNTPDLIFTDDKYSDIESFKNFLKEQYAKGTPVKVSLRYHEADYEEEHIQLPRIPTFKGTTILEVDTELQPSNMEVIYLGSQKGE